MDIFFYAPRGEFGFLSNFWPQPISVDGRVWGTSEHYFQAMKSPDAERQGYINCLRTPFEAKMAGKETRLRVDWEEVKEFYMLKALRAKFLLPNMRKKLLMTTSHELHEDSPGSPSGLYWGFVGGRGKDRLGKLLMQVRGEIEEIGGL